MIEIPFVNRDRVKARQQSMVPRPSRGRVLGCASLVVFCQTRKLVEIITLRETVHWNFSRRNCVSVNTSLPTFLAPTQSQNQHSSRLAVTRNAFVDRAETETCSLDKTCEAHRPIIRSGVCIDQSQ